MKRTILMLVLAILFNGLRLIAFQVNPPVGGQYKKPVQHIISFTEIDQLQKLTPVVSPWVADVNSTISLRLDVLALQLTMSSKAAKESISEEYLKLLQGAVNTMMGDINKINSAALNNQAARQNLKEFANSFIAKLVDYLILPANEKIYPGTPLWKALEDDLSDNGIYTIKSFNAIKNEFERVNKEAVEELKKRKVSFRLGAWLQSTTSSDPRPIHLEGFDKIQNGEYYKVPMVTLAISKEEQERYKAIKSMPDNFDAFFKTYFGNIKSQLKPEIEILINDYKNTVTVKINELTTTLDATSHQVTATYTSVKAQLDVLLAQMQNITHEWNIISTDITMLNDASKIPQLLLDIDMAIANFKAFCVQADQFFNKTAPEIQNILTDISSAYGQTVINLKGVLNNTKDSAESVASRLKQSLEGLVTSRLPDLSSSALTYSNEVYKLEPNQIPETTYIDLIKSGKRDIGEKIYVKASIEVGEGVSVSEQVLEMHQILIQKVMLYNTIKATMIFAKTPKQNNGNSDFQLMPSYTIAFHKGSRKSVAWNQYFSIGLGVNIATLDFNNDNTPEIGIAPTVTFFKDYVQLGAGRNFGQDKNYFFFGVRLPLLGFNNNNIKVGD